MLIRSELHIDPKTLSEEEFIERSRDVMWLMEYRAKRLTEVIEETITPAILKAYIEINRVVPHE